MSRASARRKPFTVEEMRVIVFVPEKRWPRGLRKRWEENKRVTEPLIERATEIRARIAELSPAGKMMVKKVLAHARVRRDSELAHVPMSSIVELIRVLTKKGRVRSRETQAKIRQAARCLANHMTKRQMTNRLFPDSNVTFDKRYTWTRVFCGKYKQEINDEVLRLKRMPRPTP